MASEKQYHKKDANYIVASCKRSRTENTKVA